VENLRVKPHFEYLIENGILTAMKAWLGPLPDGSLPNITIRTELIRVLNDVWRTFVCGSASN
jgi:transcription factor SPN1